MTISKCPVCGCHRASKEHKQRSGSCSKEARHIGQLRRHYQKQENDLIYVAITRAKKELFYIESE